MPIKRDAKGRFAGGGGHASSRAGGKGGAAGLAKRGADHVVAKSSGASTKSSTKSGAGVVNGVKIPAYIAKRSLQVAQKNFKADPSMANQAKVLKHAKTAGVDATKSLARRGADHVVAKNAAAAKAKKPTKAQARAAALRIAQGKMLAAANRK